MQRKTPGFAVSREKHECRVAWARQLIIDNRDYLVIL